MVELEYNKSKKEQTKGIIRIFRVSSLLCFTLSLYCWYRAYNIDLGDVIKITFNYEPFVIVIASIGLFIMFFKEHWNSVDKLIVALNVLSIVSFCVLYLYLFIEFALG